MVLALGKFGNRRKLFRIAGRQFEFAAVAADQRSLAVALDPQLGVGRFADDQPKPVDRQNGVARGFHLDLVERNANAHLQIGGHHRAAAFGALAADFEFHVAQIGLGLRAGATTAAI